jgi:transcriptional regulator with XRE-family HTH domain
MNALGRYLRVRSKEVGISLAELARRTGLSRQTVHAIGKQGGRLPEMETVVKIAVELGVHPLQLFHLVFEDYQLPARLERQYRERDDRSTFIADVTIPDGTVVAAGARFTKTWEVQNVGTVAWDGRLLRCMDEEILISRCAAQGPAEPRLVTDRLKPAAPSIPVPYTPPGGIARMSVDFQAPVLPGTCVSYWKSFFADGTPCFPKLVGLTCKVRVVSMTAALRGQ